MVTCRGLTSGPALGAGVEQVAEVVAGDHPKRHRTAHIQRLGGPGGLQLVGGLGDRGLEVQRVGGVQHGVRVDGAVPAGLVEVHIDLPGLRGCLAAFFGFVGVEGVEGFLAELLGEHHPDLVRHRREPPVHMGGARGRQRMVCWAIRAARHHCRSPAVTRSQISGSR